VEAAAVSPGVSIMEIPRENSGFSVMVTRPIVARKPVVHCGAARRAIMDRAS